jgi:class 3 adenylate cyclase
VPNALILFIDVESFSKRPTPEQRKLLRSLNDTVTREIADWLRPDTGFPSVIALPTGDGMLLAFHEETRQRWELATVLELADGLHAWAGENDTRLRIGVHTGTMEIVTDINGRPNVVGETVNVAQRVMDAADPGQTLMSDDCYRHKWEGRGAKSRHALYGPHAIVAKHGVHCAVWQVGSEAGAEAPVPPKAKDNLLLAFSRPGKPIEEFAERLEGASEALLLMLSGGRLAEQLEATGLPKKLKKLRVVLPVPEMFEVHSATPYPSQLEVVAAIARWVALREKFASSKVSIEVRTTVNRPLFGASLLDWRKPGGRIHVSPYLWGIHAPETPGFELMWPKGFDYAPAAYAVYAEAADHLLEESIRV